MKIKKIAVILLTLSVVAFFVSLGTSTAKSHTKNRSPESIVTCEGAGDYLVLARTTPASIILDECTAWPEPIAQCSHCIRSLESQGCIVVDVVVTNHDPGAQAGPRTTFLLSCEKP